MLPVFKNRRCCVVLILKDSGSQTLRQPLGPIQMVDANRVTTLLSPWNRFGAGTSPSLNARPGLRAATQERFDPFAITCS